MGIFAVFAKKVEQWRNYNQGVKGYLEYLKQGKYAEFEKEGKNKSFEHMTKEQLMFTLTGEDADESEDPEGQMQDEDVVLMRTYRKKRQEASNLLNSAKLTLGTIREAWEMIEDHIYQYGVGNLDILFKEDLSKPNLVRLKRAVGFMDDEEMDILQRVCKSVLLRQLVGTTRQNIA
jgi:hypothetical protein